MALPLFALGIGYLTRHLSWLGPGCASQLGLLAVLVIASVILRAPDP